MIKLDKIILSISPPVRVTGKSVAGGGRSFQYKATKCVALCTPSGRVSSFLFEGPRVMKKNAREHGWISFMSDDPALNEVRLTARRIAAPAATRTESGAR